MIVLDEQLNDPQLQSQIDRWYKGVVSNIKDLRPYRVIKDDLIPVLLLQLKQPTFVTINYDDFWRRIDAHSGYCVACFKLTRDRRMEVPESLRRLLSTPELATKRKRMGKVISVTDHGISFYE